MSLQSEWVVFVPYAVQHSADPHPQWILNSCECEFFHLFIFLNQKSFCGPFNFNLRKLIRRELVRLMRLAGKPKRLNLTPARRIKCDNHFGAQQ
jgi:hypothetical protein